MEDHDTAGKIFLHPFQQFGVGRPKKTNKFINVEDGDTEGPPESAAGRSSRDAEKRRLAAEEEGGESERYRKHRDAISKLEKYGYQGEITRV